MSKISAKKLLFFKLSSYFNLGESNNILLYYIPANLQNIIKGQLKMYKAYTFHKRNIKHSFIGAPIKMHFMPGMGAFKFKSLEELQKFLKAEFSDLKKKAPGLLPVTLLVRQGKLFLLPFKHFDVVYNYLKNLSFFQHALKTFCFLWLKFFHNYLAFLCKLSFGMLKGKHANA